MASAPVLLEIQTNDNPNVTERRFPASMSIVDLKSRLEMITGASSATMNLAFYDTFGELIANSDDTKCIGDYVLPGSEQKLQLRVNDVNIVKNDDFSSVPKYDMADEDYEKRTQSVRSFKMHNKLGRFSEKVSAMEDDSSIEGFKVGDRCEVSVKNVPPRRGQVLYVGKLAGKSGYFVGVRYDEPYGKNDGSFEGTRYFECAANYGSFVRPIDVKVGDYPEIEIDFDN